MEIVKDEISHKENVEFIRCLRREYAKLLQYKIWLGIFLWDVV